MQKPTGLFAALTFLGVACLSPGAETPAASAPAPDGAAAPDLPPAQPNPGPPAPPPEVIRLDHIHLSNGEVKTGREIAVRDDLIWMTSAGIERKYNVETIDTIDTGAKDPAFWTDATALALRKGNGRLAFDLAFRAKEVCTAKAPFLAVLQTPNFSRLAVSLKSADAAADGLRKVRDRAAADRDGIAARIRASEQTMDQIMANINSRLPNLHPRTRADQIALQNEVANEQALLEELKAASARLQPIQEEYAAVAKQRDDTDAKLRAACLIAWTRAFAPGALPDEKTTPAPSAAAAVKPDAGPVTP